MKAYAGEKAVISLTSWKKRIDTVYKTIQNLFDICTGFHICLTLSTDEFPNREKELPKSLMKLSDKFEIIWVKENIRCFKKIILAMAKYSNLPIISADDDCIYIKNYAEELYQAYLKNNQCIYSYNTDTNSKPFVFQDGPCALYPPSCFLNDFCKYLTNEVLHTWHDDIYNGILAYKLGIPIIEVDHEKPYVHHDEQEALSAGISMNGGLAINICYNAISKSKKIIGIYDCGPRLPFNINSVTMGGSETWIREIALQFSELNWHIIIFANVPHIQFIDNIELVPANLLQYRCSYQHFDKFIFSRGLENTQYIDCNDISLMFHDTELARIGSKSDIQFAKKLKHIYVLSDYGKKCVENLSVKLPLDRFKITNNGIDYTLYNKTVEKTNSMVWSSCKERGFDFYVQYVVPHIIKEIPDFTTYICSYNDYANLENSDLNIKFLGKLNKQELADIQLQAKIWCYPNLGHVINIANKDVPFGETFCITAVENVAAKNIIIAGDMGGLQTTLSGYPLVGKEFYTNDRIEIEKYNEYGKYLADLCIKALKDEFKPELPDKMYTWKSAALSLL